MEEVEDLRRRGVPLEVINSGWVLVQKPDGSVRARCVATQVNYGTEMDAFAATPTIIGQRVLLLRALQNHWKVKTADISVAFFTQQNS